MAQVIVRYEPSAVPLGVNVFSIEDETTPLDVSVGGVGEAWVSVTQPGEYLIRITRPRGASGEYSLQIRDAVCLPDAFEKPWQNDFASQASSVGVQRVSGALCPGDVDWFVFEAGGVGLLETSSDIRFVDELDRPVTQVTNGTRFMAQGDGVYVFDILPIREPALRCEAQGGSPIPLGVAQTLNFDGADDFADVCLSDGAPEAVFAVDLPSEGQIEVRYEGDALMTNYGVYDNCEVEPVFCGNGLGDARSRVLDSGRYYVVVQGPSVGTVTVNHIEAFGCDDLNTVPLNQSTAVSLGARMADFPGDCFLNGPNGMVQFTLNELSRVSIELSGTTGMLAQTGLALRGACDEPSSELSCVNGASTLTVDALEAGSYSLLIQGAGAGQVNIAATPIENLVFKNGCSGEAAALSSGDEVTISGQLNGQDEWSADACGGANGDEQFLNFSLAEQAEVTVDLDVPGTLAILNANCNQTLACGAASNPVISEAPSVSQTLFPGSYTVVVDGVTQDFETTITVQ